MNNKELISLAIKARESSYSPYSGLAVGAALLCADGSVFTGCNIEAASFSPTVCAERTAFFKAVSEGNRDFEKIAVVGGRRGGELVDYPPCGVCRQVMAEFCGRDFIIIIAVSPDNYVESTLGDLLPHSFTGGQ